MEVVLINDQLFKENSPVRDDVVITDFVPYISIAQKLYIEPILGQPLTNELQAQVKAASQPNAPTDAITPANQALIVMLAPALSFYAVYQGLPFHWASIVNKGVTLRESENSKAADSKDIAQLRRWVKDDAETFSRDLVAYLCRCRDKYPSWQPKPGCGCPGDGTAGSVKTQFDTGIYISKQFR